MCGRFAFFAKGHFGYESLQLPEPPPFERYNIAPSQDILAIRTAPETGRPEWVLPLTLNRFVLSDYLDSVF